MLYIFILPIITMQSSELDVDILLKHHKKRDLALMVVKLKKETVVALRAVAKCKFFLQKMQLIMGENDLQYSDDCTSSTELVEELSSSTELVEELSSPTVEVEELPEINNTHNNSANSRTALGESIIAEFDKPFIDSASTSICQKLVEPTPELNTLESAPKKRKINPVENVAAYKKASSEMLCMNSHVLYAPPSVNIPPLHLRDPRRPKKCFTDIPMKLPVPQYQSRQVPTQRQNGLQNASMPNEQVQNDLNSVEVKVEEKPVLTSHNVEQIHIQNELAEEHLEHILLSSQISAPTAANTHRVSPQSPPNQAWALLKSPKHEKDENNADLQHPGTSSRISPGNAENMPMVAPRISLRRSPLSPKRESDGNMSKTPHLDHTVKSSHCSPVHVEKRARTSPQSPANRRLASPDSPKYENDWYMSRNTHITTPHLKHRVRSSHISLSHTEDRPRTPTHSPANRRHAPLSPEYRKDVNMTRNKRTRIPHLEHRATSRHLSPTHFENSPRASPQRGYQCQTFTHQKRAPLKSPEQKKYRHRHIRMDVSPTYSDKHNTHIHKSSRSKTPERDHSRRCSRRPRPRCDRRVQSYCNSTAHRRPDVSPRFY